MSSKKDYDENWKKYGITNDDGEKIEPVLKFSNQFKNWYSLLDKDTSRYPSNVEEWMNLCGKLGICYEDCRAKCGKKTVKKEEIWKYYEDKCRKHNNLPEDPGDLYGDDFGTLSKHLRKVKSTGMLTPSQPVPRRRRSGAVSETDYVKSTSLEKSNSREKKTKKRATRVAV